MLSIAVDGRNLKQAFLNFNNEESVNELIQGGSIIREGHEMRLSRYLPKSYPLANYFTTNILLTIDDVTKQMNKSQRKIPEFDLRKHFDPLGRIINCYWQSDNEVILQFEK